MNQIQNICHISLNQVALFFYECKSRTGALVKVPDSELIENAFKSCCMMEMRHDNSITTESKNPMLCGIY